MKLRRLIKLMAGAVTLAVLGLLAAQLIPVTKTNPPVTDEPAWDSPQTRELARRACFDCHSNETNWPWYSNIAPVSWVIISHVNEGRRKVNFSAWSPRQQREVIETVLEGEMPPLYYRLTNPQARLTQAQTQALVNGLQATFNSQSDQTAPAAEALRRLAGQYTDNSPDDRSAGEHSHDDRPGDESGDD
ncbi:MAG: heme-binding domain-containing protein [Anaerolineae bacterium]